MPSDFVLTDRFALQTHYLSLTDSLLTDSTTTSVPSKDFQRIRNNSGLQRNIWRIKKIRQNLQNGQTSSSASISNSTTTTVDKEAEYYERCPKKQAKIDQRKATRQKHLTSWLQAIESKSNSLYCIDIFDGVTKDRGITLEGYKICVHSHCIQDKSGKGRVEILTTSYTKCSLPCKFGRLNAEPKIDMKCVVTAKSMGKKWAQKISYSRRFTQYAPMKSSHGEKESKFYLLCYKCIGDQSEISTSTEGGSSSGDSFSNSSVEDDNSDDNEALEFGSDGYGDDDASDADDDEQDDFDQDDYSEADEEDFNSDIYDDDAANDQNMNPDGEEGQSAADDGASLFEEFSDSLTELRVGQKLYQSGQEDGDGQSGQTGADGDSLGDEDWSIYSYSARN